MIDEIKAEIKRMKNSLDSTNSDYYSGYLSACSSIEGHIAMLEQKEKKDLFPGIEGALIEMCIDGEWIRGKVVKGYRFNDGIVTMETKGGKRYWCGQDRTDIYREAKGKEE